MGFTRPFEQHTTYLAKVTDKTTVTKLMRAWVTVGNMIFLCCGGIHVYPAHI